MNTKNIKIQPEAVFRIRGENIFWGPGIKELLIQVEKTKSIKLATQNMYMSYTKARKLIVLAEKELGFELIHSYSGGTVKGYTCLTEKGKIYLNKCIAIQEDVQRYCEEKYREYFK